MTTYSSVFGSNTVPSADNSYTEVALTADTEFYWPELATGDNLIADTMEVTASAAYDLQFPEASSVSVGRAIVVRNVGAFAVTVTNADGGTLSVVEAGVAKTFQITDNSSAAGEWGVFTLGAGTSEADAYELAGNGLTVATGKLAVNYPVQNAVTDLTLNTTNRSKCIEFTAANKTLTLMIASVAGAGFGFTVKNSTNGSVTINAAGSDTIDSYTTFNLSPLESVDLISSGTKWLILTRGVSTVFQFTKLVKDISSATTFTLTSAEATNKLLQFIGTPTADTEVIVPSVVAVYYVQNSFTDAGYSLTIKTSAGTGVELEYFDRVVIYCDGVNVVLAQSTDAASAAASAIAAYNSQVAAGISETNAADSETNAAESETNAAASEVLAAEWAVKTTGQVATTDYSSKAYALGGTGVTSVLGAAKEWAITVGAAVISGAYSAKEWAVGTFTRGSAGGGSSKDWATYVAGTVDNAGYSAKYHANLADTSASNAADSASDADGYAIAAGLSATAAHDSEVAAAASAASIAGGPIASISVTAPVTSSGGSTPTLGISAATTGAAGSMSAADKTKLDAITGTNTGDQDLSSYATKTGTETLTNKTISGSANTITADGTNAVGFLDVPQNSQSTAYTCVLGDKGKHILHPTSDTTARTFTIPANSSVAYPVGTAITFVNQSGAGSLTISITTDTMRLAGAGTTGSRTLAANGTCTALKLTATEWLISGTNLT